MVYVGCSAGLFMLDAELEEVTNLTEDFKAKTILFDGSSHLAVLGKSKKDKKWYLYEYSVDDNMLLSKRAIPTKFVKERKWGCFWGCLSVYQDYWVITKPIGLLVDISRTYNLQIYQQGTGSQPTMISIPQDQKDATCSVIDKDVAYVACHDGSICV